MLTLKCPNCGADLRVEDKQEFAVCRYCDSRISLTDERTPEQIKAEAERIRAETERMAFERQAKLEEEQRRHLLEAQGRSMLEEQRENTKLCAAMMFLSLVVFLPFCFIVPQTKSIIPWFFFSSGLIGLLTFLLKGIFSIRKENAIRREYHMVKNHYQSN